MGHASGDYAVELANLRKTFGSVIANEAVDLLVKKGTIHGIIGENGAGKSTAMKMLFGMISPDSGQIRIHGNPVQWRSPRDAMTAGLGMVHQHFMLAEPVTALDNILLSGARNPFARLNRSEARAKLEQLGKRYGLEVDLDAKVEDLTVGLQQRLEILKLLYREANIIILDEPTAVLTPQEIHSFFDQLERLRAEGKTILLITHKLKEVMAITNHVTVLRAGRVVGHRATHETSPNELAELMIGRALKTPPHRKPTSHQETVLEVNDLSVNPRLHNVSFHIRSGEIVGVAGVEGNGQSQLLNALILGNQYTKQMSGDVKLLSQAVISQGVSKLRPAQLRELGMGVLPENRQVEGLLMNRPLYENFLLGYERTSLMQSRGLLKLSELRKRTNDAMEEFDVRPRQVDLNVKQLSGGNQQKLVVARELQTNPKFIIAAHPTRGVDIGAIEFIHHQLLKARERGAGVLLVSSELEEIMALADRILVFCRGTISAEFERSNFDENKLGLAMGGSL